MKMKLFRDKCDGKQRLWEMKPGLKHTPYRNWKVNCNQVEKDEYPGKE